MSRDGLVEVSGASTAVAVESLRGSIWAVGGSLTGRPGQSERTNSLLKRC